MKLAGELFPPIRLKMIDDPALPGFFGGGG
jgi:hypothetical protein